MRSRIYIGETTHCRHQPRRHAFGYPMFWLGVDLAELGTLDRRVRGFGHNRFSLVGLRDQDYGPPGDGTIEEKLHAVLARGLASPPRIAQVTLMTIPRVAGYVFTPVSFYLCRDESGEVAAFVAEVRNTFGEKHHYVARPKREGDALTCRIPKRFHVSPFLDTRGEYLVRLRDTSDQFEIEIDLCEDGERVFSAGMRGQARPLTSRALLATLARMPLFAATIMVRIHWQALLLTLARRVSARIKPDPVDSMTIPAERPSVWFRLRAGLVRLAHRPEPRTPLMAEGDM